MYREKRVTLGSLEALNLVPIGAVYRMELTLTRGAINWL